MTDPRVEYLRQRLAPKFTVQDDGTLSSESVFLYDLDAWYLINHIDSLNAELAVLSEANIENRRLNKECNRLERELSEANNKLAENVCGYCWKKMDANYEILPGETPIIHDRGAVSPYAKDLECPECLGRGYATMSNEVGDTIYECDCGLMWKDTGLKLGEVEK